MFTASFASTRLVEHVSLPVFLWRYFAAPAARPRAGTRLVALPDLLRAKPHRTLLLFPEATPTNGRGILRFTPALAAAPRNTKIFPISLKYTPADITTPVPGVYFGFLWSLLSRPTHCIRVRIAEIMYNNEADKKEAEGGESSDTLLSGEEAEEPMSRICERTSEALARIGRVKRLNLGVKEKIGFVGAWKRKNRLS